MELMMKHEKASSTMIEVQRCNICDWLAGASGSVSEERYDVIIWGGVRSVG